MKKDKKIVIFVAIGIALIALVVLFISMSIKGASRCCRIEGITSG